MRPPLRLVPYKTISLEVAQRLAASRLDLDPLASWSEEVLVPSAGAGQSISAALLAHLPAGVAALQVHSIDAFARRVLNDAGEFPRVASPEERRLAMRRALRAVDHPMMESRGAAGMLERSYRDIRDSGLSLADMRTRVARVRGLRNPERTRAMLSAWAEYERLIAALGVIDPAELLGRAAAKIRSGASIRPQLIAGFYDVTGAQRQLLESLFDTARVAAVWMPIAHRGETYAFADPLASFFAARCDEPAAHAVPRFLGSSGSSGSVSQGSTAPTGRMSSRNPGNSEEPEELQILASPAETRDDELAGVCAAIAGLLADGVAASDIGIVGRSLEPFDERTLIRVAAAHGFRTPLSEEVPLIAHRFGRAAATLFRLRDGGFHRGDVIELLRDGLRTRTRVDVDALDVATRRARIAGGTSAELRIARSRSQAIDSYVAVVAELEELTATEPLALLQQLTSMFTIESELDLAAAECLEEIAAIVARTTVWGGATDPLSILDALQNATLPGARAADGPLVWAGDLMRFRGRTFAHTFAIRMQDELFPQRRAEDPLLPDADRRILGLREIGDGIAEENLLHQLLIDGTSTELRFTWATSDGFGKPLRPSRYVRRAAEAGTTPLPTPRARELETDGLTRRLQMLVNTGTDSVFDGRITSIHEQIAARLESVSPTQLEDFGECPQKFLLKHILNVEDLDAPDREIELNPRDKGTLNHSILEHFYRELSKEQIATAKASLPQLPDDIVERLERFIDEAFDELEAEAPAFNSTVRTIERRATRRLLRDFVAADLQDFTDSGLLPRHFEYRFGRKHRTTPDHQEPFIVNAGAVTLCVEGTVDRIDTDQERYRIVDYKSGKALRHKNLGVKIDRGVRLQLALYAMAVAEFFDADPSKVSATIKPLVIADAAKSKFDFELGEKREKVLEALGVFARAILDGRFPAFPEEKDFDSCKYCAVAHSCRTRHDSDEKYAVLQHGDALTLLRGGDAE